MQATTHILDNLIAFSTNLFFLFTFSYILSYNKRLKAVRVTAK